MSAQSPGENRLAITRIVLYKHGVGYFEREGLVTGDATVPLTFKTAQMKDVLKSLYAIDLGGGRISTILYDSKDPIQKQLEDILFQVPEGSALTQFLAQLKGARVRANAGATPTVGSVLGIEPVQRKIDDSLVTTHKLVLLREDGAIQAVDVLDASSIEILDETVRKDLARMMDIYAKARYADRKTVNLRAVGDGERRVRAGYIIETPIWKTSYRLLLEADKAPLLQGWAIVENRTDEDWNDVKLSFVAGSPQSFVLDLYTSYYPKRPVVSVGAGLAAEAPVPMPAGPSSPGGGRMARGRVASKKAMADAEGMAAAEDLAMAPSLGEALEMSNVPMAEGAAVGDLFSYTASGPVTIKQGQAALVPILLERVGKSERVLYWRRDRSEHPYHAVLLDNSTALTLEKGPVTVFEGSTCLGEGMLPRTMKPGMREMVTYALETAVEVDERGDSRALPVTRATLANGLLTTYYRESREARFELRNKSNAPYVLYLDHQKAGGDFKLVEPAAATEELPGHHRFKLELAANAKREFVVREEREVSAQIGIVNQGVDQIRFYLQQKYLSPAARAFLESIAGLLDQRATVERELQSYAQERASLNEAQENARRNMTALRDTPEEKRLRDQYVARLSAALERSDELQRLEAAARQRRDQLVQEITDKVQAFRD
ncbi:MAG: DUF4139 domain-containing protein [Planctomycetota bacterium]